MNRQTDHHDRQNEAPVVDSVQGEYDSGDVVSLQRLVRAGNRRWKRLMVLEAMGLAVAAPLALLWTIVLMDSVFHFATVWRWSAAGVFLLGALWQVQRLRASWRQAAFTDEQVALAMERNTPGGVENRLINALQLSSGAASPMTADVRAAVIRENVRQLSQLHVEQASRLGPSMMRVGLAALVIVLGLSGYILQPQRFSTSTARVLLPFADITPMYRTQLRVYPGDVTLQPGESVRVVIEAEGRRPESVTLLSRGKAGRMQVDLPLPPGTNKVEYVFRNLREPLTYAVRGGDFVSPFYRIDVPMPLQMERLRVTYRFPDYTGLADRVQDSGSATMQGVYGTQAAFRLHLSQPVEGLRMVLEPLETVADGASEEDGAEVLELRRVSPTIFEGTLTLERSRRYWLETGDDQRLSAPPGGFEIHAHQDQPPDLRLAGVNEADEIMVDALLPLVLSGQDDFGLTEVGFFVRHPSSEQAQWEPVRVWTLDPASRHFNEEWVFAVADLDAVEGDPVELAIRGRDNYPGRQQAWHTGQRYTVTLGDDETRLQILYEQILRTEQNLERLIQEGLDLSDTMGRWMRRFHEGANADAAGDDVTSALSTLSEQQVAWRDLAVRVTRDMPSDVETLQRTLGLLADSEMTRSVRMIRQVGAREAVDEKRQAMGEARLTQERTLRGLRDVREAFTRYREDWELDHMIPFLDMLARRQERMGSVSREYGRITPHPEEQRARVGNTRRQRRLRELTRQAGIAFSGMADRQDLPLGGMAEIFEQTSMAMDEREIPDRMQTAETYMREGRWLQAATPQEEAAAALTDLHERLVHERDEAIQRMMREIRELAESSLEAQAAIQQLDPGYRAQSLEGDRSVMAEVIRLSELSEAMAEQRFETPPDSPPMAEGTLADYLDSHVGSGTPVSTEPRDFSIMTLPSQPTAQMELIPGFETDDRMAFSLIQEYQDVVGDLLDEADDLRDDFQRIVNMLQGQDVEGGDIGRGGHGMASVSAAAPTGNLKPDTHEHGGASRVGRQGARAHGLAVGESFVSRRGRDEAQEGSLEIPDVEGSIQETMSADPSDDHSTGMGGVDIESDRQQTFSLKDAGEWDDAIAERMQRPQSVYQIVERAGAPLSPEVADALRSMEHREQQLVERVKRIRKELDNLFLPSDHLDDALQAFSAGMDRLREQPDADVFRTQIETLERLVGAVMVFDRPDSEFQPGMALQPALRGDILDEPASDVPPGYDDVVKAYYERLATP